MENIMESESSQKKRRGLRLVTLVLAIVLVAVVSSNSIAKLRQELYVERAYNLGRIIDKIAANIKVVLETQLDEVSFNAELVERGNFSDEQELSAFIGGLEKMNGKKYEKEQLVMIDSNGECLTSDGMGFRMDFQTDFQWEESSILRSGEQRILVSNLNGLELTDAQMLFLVPLPKEISVENRTFTHICRVMDMGIMDNYIMKANYMDRSAIFIVESSGDYLYKRAENSIFASVSNLISKLETCEYRYKTTSGQMKDSIQNQSSGCTCAVVEGENYFVVYQALGINDWGVVYLIPEIGMGGNASSFMNSVILAISLMALMVMVVVLGFVVFAYRSSLKQHSFLSEQYQKAADAERSANVAKTRFLSSMSHDIRTPMNAIIGMTTLAEKHISDTGYVLDCLKKVKLSSNHLLALINDILDISKIESGKMALNPVVFSLSESIHNMFHIVMPQAKAKNQEFHISIEKIEHDYLMADELRLNQVFINILTNAVKYTPEHGEITATIREELCPDRENTVVLTYTVQDNGIGMSKEFMKNMYGSFSRAADSRVDKIQGTGLGLAICKQLIDMMGGTIECESELGEGTKFTITLVLETAEPLEGNYMLPDMRLLLVDDDDSFLETATELLEEMGVCVETATGGRMAVDMVDKQHEKGEDYAAVLVAWKMAGTYGANGIGEIDGIYGQNGQIGQIGQIGMDGIDTIREIHERYGNAIPLILVNSYGSTDIEDVADGVGAVGFIRKPFFKASLYQQLEHYLKLAEEGKDEMHQDVAGMRLLVAEDNDLNWEIVQGLLEMAGVEAVRVENGKLCVDRLAKAHRGEFDAVLMDVQMPVMDGREATREIRKMDKEGIRNIPVIAMTADAFHDDIIACLEAGMNAHISKPLDMDRLFFELRKIKMEQSQLQTA